jgi:hypothetical protein
VHPTLTPEALVTRLDAAARHHDLVPAMAGDEWTAKGETIRAKWFLGGRKVTYRVTCRLDGTSQAARVRDSIAESSWGIPPPSLQVEKTVQTGTRVSVSQSQQTAGAGGGSLDSGRLRGAIEAVIKEAGWRVE